jgi:hypothetical protein
MIVREDTEMNYRFNLDKALEAVAIFLEKGGGRMKVLKLVKLMYLLDRTSLSVRGLPVTGGEYYSLANGPITSEVLDLINSDYWGVDNPGRWSEFIGERENHGVELKSSPGRQHLSDAEIEMIEAIWNEHADKDQWQLVKWCHDHCDEWDEVVSGRSDLPVENLFKVLGKSDDQIERLKLEIAGKNQVSVLFAS